MSQFWIYNPLPRLYILGTSNMWTLYKNTILSLYCFHWKPFVTTRYLQGQSDHLTFVGSWTPSCVIATIASIFHYDIQWHSLHPHGHTPFFQDLQQIFLSPLHPSLHHHFKLRKTYIKFQSPGKIFLMFADLQLATASHSPQSSPNDGLLKTHMPIIPSVYPTQHTSRGTQAKYWILKPKYWILRPQWVGPYVPLCLAPFSLVFCRSSPLSVL